MSNAEHCVCCGQVIPEGRQVCVICGYEARKEKQINNLYLLNKKAIVSALEKQIPRKPIEDRYPWCICPNCGGSVYLKHIQEHISNGETSHCEHCEWWSEIGAFITIALSFVPILGIVVPIGFSVDCIRNVIEQIKESE